MINIFQQRYIFRGLLILMTALFLITACGRNEAPEELVLPAPTATLEAATATAVPPTNTAVPDPTATIEQTAVPTTTPENNRPEIIRVTAPMPTELETYSDPYLGLAFQFSPAWTLSITPEELNQRIILAQNGYEIHLRVQPLPDVIPTCSGLLDISNFGNFWKDRLAMGETWRAKVEMGFVNGFHNDEFSFISLVWPNIESEDPVRGTLECNLAIEDKLIGIDYRLPVSVAALTNGGLETTLLAEMDQIVTSMRFEPPQTASNIRCSRPDELLMEGHAFVNDPQPCLVWNNYVTDETGYQITIQYEPTGEFFQYHLPIDSEQLLLPEFVMPDLEQAVEPCRRLEFQVEILALRTATFGNQTVVSGQGALACNSVGEPVPETAVVPATPESTNGLLNRLELQEVDEDLSRLVGWEDGYRRNGYCDDGPYRWLDDSHLLLFPIMGYITVFENERGGELTQPVILDITTGRKWVSSQIETDICHQPVYSSELNALIESKGGIVSVRGLDGAVQNTFPGGNPLYLGDTGTRLLAGRTWLNLTTGESVQVPIDIPERFRKVAWANDDSRFYICCVHYGDVETNRFEQAPDLGDIFASGIGVGHEYNGEFAQWFADDTYVMDAAGAYFWINTNGEDVASPGRVVTPTIPLIDPINQTYINLGAELELNATFGCGWSYHIRPFHDQLWLQNCEGGLLVEIPSLEVEPFEDVQFVSWSPNGRYALLTTEGHYALLNPASNELTLLTDIPDTAGLPVWSSNDDYVALLDHGVYLVETAVGQTRPVPTLTNVGEMVWQPNSDTLAVALSDRSIRFVSFDNGIGDGVLDVTGTPRALRWSPNGNTLSYIVDQDLFIFTPERK